MQSAGRRIYARKCDETAGVDAKGRLSSIGATRLMDENPVGVVRGLVRQFIQHRGPQGVPAADSVGDDAGLEGQRVARGIEGENAGVNGCDRYGERVVFVAAHDVQGARYIPGRDGAAGDGQRKGTDCHLQLPVGVVVIDLDAELQGIGAIDGIDGLQAEAEIREGFLLYVYEGSNQAIRRNGFPGGADGEFGAADREVGGGGRR
jgi:hypothetical protein